MTLKSSPLPPGVLHRGLKIHEAAAYIGVGRDKFRELVASGKMPKAKYIGTIRIWDRHRIDQAFEALSDEPHDGGMNPWDDAVK